MFEEKINLKNRTFREIFGIKNKTQTPEGKIHFENQKIILRK